MSHYQVDWRLGDYAIVIEALAQLGGNPNALETQREQRAWTLIELLAAEAGIPAPELLELGWHGPGSD